VSRELPSRNDEEHASALGRVRAVLRAAARIADATDPLGRRARAEIPAVTGLSRENVELALEEHLETEASDEDLHALVSCVHPAPAVHVVLSSNVFVAAARALALALASSPVVTVKPSRREPTMALLLAEALADDGMTMPVVSELAVGAGHHVHAYGRDETLRAIASTLPEGAGFWAHGTGMGVVALSESELTVEHAEALARDAGIFDQRGCLSPRVILVETGGEGAIAFAAELARAMERFAARIPVGAIDPAELAARRSYLDAAVIAGAAFERPGGAVGVDASPRMVPLPASPRVLHLACVGGPAEARALLGPLLPSIVCLGGTGALSIRLAPSIPWARRASPGSMQRPPLDGPVDRRAPAPRTPL
jgi:hypothetical protein